MLTLLNAAKTRICAAEMAVRYAALSRSRDVTLGNDNGTDGQTDRQMDRQTDGQTECDAICGPS